MLYQPVVKSPPLQTSPLVFVIEDDRLQAEYVTAILKSADFDVVCFKSATDFLNNHDHIRPACVLSDVVLPDKSGLELQEIMQDRNIHMPLVFMTAHADVSMAKTALKKGALDLLEKPVATLELISIVRKALALASEQQLREQEKESFNTRLECLTKREKQILESLIGGQSNKDLAKNMSLSVRTVETHRANILKKMEVSSFSQILRFFYKYQTQSIIRQ
ncbi:MAG: response regulator [Gammaproteobacteria bacterium]|nr:response regulator [Gammaproteobacteria bacterium]MDH5802315.1 response regulator [Gammaproteobacteria bacterium]